MSKTILLADDSITIQKIVNLTFTGEGIDVVTVGNGEAALKKVYEIRPDLVLADIFMPGRNGYEVCEHIKNTPGLDHIPVILLVGAFEPFDGGEAARVKADGHLTKPFEIKVLISAVNSLVHSDLEETVSEPPFQEVPEIPDQEIPPGKGVLPIVEEKGVEAETISEIPIGMVSENIPPETAPPFLEESKVSISAPVEEPHASETVEVEETSVSEEREKEPVSEERVEEPVSVERVEELVSKETIAEPTIEMEPVLYNAPATNLEESDPLGLYVSEPLFVGSVVTAADSRSLVVDIWEPRGSSAFMPEVLSELNAPAGVALDEAEHQRPAEKETQVGVDEPAEAERTIESAEIPTPQYDEAREAETSEGPAAEEPVVAVPEREPVSSQSDIAVPAFSLEDPDLIDRIARKVIEKLSRDIIERIAWEVVPDLAEIMIKDQIKSHLKTDTQD